METARNIIPRPVLRFPGTRMATHRLSLPPNGLGTGECRISFRSKRYNGISSREFSDSEHLKYYVSPARCGGKKEKSKKKQLKLMRRLSRDLPIFSNAVCGEEGNGSLIGEVKEKMISEATEILIAELRNRRLERKEQKRKRREERASLIKNRPRCDSGSSPSSSSSSGSSSPESSDDSDCSREVVSMKQMRSNALNPFMEIESANAIKEEATQEDQHRDTVSGAKSNDSSPQNLSDGAQIGASGRKIEICMGGKCRKLGAAALLEEFERKMGMESAVVGCKCMGKCTNGPNVRIFNCTFENEDMRVEDSIKPQLNLLCIGVGLKDVGIHWSSTSGQ
ncbi:hypothetical protein NC652_006995 [Populus alba x Populus x berolinensis]|uniref:Diacylglycerol O-acyltransferase 3 n=1 Tax=Populus tomentosa TaxID=118781 RepID=A0A8X8AER8_POPTO|nr:hypothetical protein POTOM_008610 [Populus tomentosa]KAJ6955750.1 hypothetical protein NC652_006995 [Populus alba x Populus x berolinensis]